MLTSISFSNVVSFISMIDLAILSIVLVVLLLLFGLSLWAAHHVRHDH